MPMPIVLTLPAADASLREEITQQIAPYAAVQAPQTFGLDEIKLVIELVGDATTIAANAAAVYTLLLALQDRTKQQRRSGIRIARLRTPNMPLEDADDRLLRYLLGLPERDLPRSGSQ